MICSNCGKELANDSKFCLFCGQPVAAAPAPAPAPMPQQYAPQQFQQPVQQAPQQYAPQYQQPAPQQYQQPAPQQFQQPVPQAPQYQQPMYQQPAPAAPAYNPAGFAPVGQQPKRFDIRRPETIVTLISCVLLLVSLFLKYYGLNKKKTSVSIATSLIKVATGWPYLINIVLILIFVFVGIKVGVFVMSILNTCWMVLVVVVNENVIKGASLQKYLVRGPGFWISIISSVGILVGGILYMIAKGKQKQAAPQYGIPTM
ncbi:MAG: zinc ribbon domain-containing protein [Clostridiales bacterium]|nr:zinc ribbon domain-containing protein [Clostridiales bacterium]